MPNSNNSSYGTKTPRVKFDYSSLPGITPVLVGGGPGLMFHTPIFMFMEHKQFQAFCLKLTKNICNNYQVSWRRFALSQMQMQILRHERDFQSFSTVFVNLVTRRIKLYNQ
jgi:hypothetical protein